MQRKKDISGQRFGKLVAIKPLGRKKQGSEYWLCKCDCGNEIEIPKINLTRTKRPTRSCGCLRVNAFNASRKHFGCKYCGSDKHYAKGYCRSCYNKFKRGTLE